MPPSLLLSRMPRNLSLPTQWWIRSYLAWPLTSTGHVRFLPLSKTLCYLGFCDHLLTLPTSWWIFSISFTPFSLYNLLRVEYSKAQSWASFSSVSPWEISPSPWFISCSHQDFNLFIQLPTWLIHCKSSKHLKPNMFIQKSWFSSKPAPILVPNSINGTTIQPVS